MWKLFKYIIVFMVLSIALTVGSALFVKGTKMSMVTGLSESQDGGAEYGKQTDQLGCLAHALDGYDSCGDTFDCHIHNSLFLHSCLPEAKPNQGFCKQVPMSDDAVKAQTWKEGRCNSIGRPTVYCDQLFGVILKFCNVDR